MYQGFVDHPTFQAVVVMILTLVGNKIWQRWLSKSSRITAEKCVDNQALCLGRVTLKIEEIHTEVTDKIDGVRRTLGALDEIRGFHTTTNQTLRLILMTLNEMCTTGEGICEEETKRMIKEELRK